MKQNFNKQRGQIGIGVIVSVAGAMLIAMVGGWVTQNNITDSKIQTVRIESENKIEGLRKDVETTKTNTFLICQSFNLKCKE